MVGVLHHRQLAPLTAPITCHSTTRHVILNFHISLAPNMKTHYICTLIFLLTLPSFLSWTLYSCMSRRPLWLRSQTMGLEILTKEALYNIVPGTMSLQPLNYSTPNTMILRIQSIRIVKPLHAINVSATT